MMQPLLSQNLFQKRIWVRCDLNVPFQSVPLPHEASQKDLQEQRITDLSRIEAVKDTLVFLSTHAQSVGVLSHWGRPQSSLDLDALSLKKLLSLCASTWGIPVTWGGDPARDPFPAHGVALFENVRFYPEEERNDPLWTQTLAHKADLYVNEAFSCSHRRHATLIGLSQYLPAFKGFQVEREIEALSKVMKHPQRLVLAVVGGAKLSTKLGLLQSLLNHVDVLALGGVMAHAFLYEDSPLKESSLRSRILLPRTVMLEGDPQPRPLEHVQDRSRICDVGPEFIQDLAALNPQTLFWNGPLGIFEKPPYNQGTLSWIRHLSSLSGKVIVAGGGDTVSAYHHAQNQGFTVPFTHLSTAGGAFLEFLEHGTLPALESLSL